MQPFNIDTSLNIISIVISSPDDNVRLLYKFVLFWYWISIATKEYRPNQDNRFLLKATESCWNALTWKDFF